MDFFLKSFGFLPDFFGFLVITRDERPVENNADLEADPDVHQAVENDEAGKGKLEIGILIKPSYISSENR